MKANIKPEIKFETNIGTFEIQSIDIVTRDHTVKHKINSMDNGAILTMSQRDIKDLRRLAKNYKLEKGARKI